MAQTENTTYRVPADGFFGELFRSDEDKYPGKALICFSNIPIDFLEAAAKRLHDMGYEKVGLWGISKGAELALTAGSLLPGLVNAVIAFSPMSTVCQGFAKEKWISFFPLQPVLQIP